MTFIARWWLPVLAALLVLGFAGLYGSSKWRQAALGGSKGFAAQVDMSPLSEVAVHTEGRLKSFDSFANGMMSLVSGSKRIDGQTPSFTYFDMLLRPGAYEDADVIYVKNKAVRAQIADALRRSDAALAERMEAFVHTGLVSRKLVLDPALRPLLDQLQADLIRTEKVVGALNTAMSVQRPEVLLGRLRIIPSPDGDPERRWHGMDELLPERGADGRAVVVPIEGLAPEAQRAITAQWIDVVNGWARQDAPMVNTAIAGLAAELPRVNPSSYPSPGRLRMESWYFAVDHMSWVWLAFMASVLPLLMWAAYRWPTALRVGLALFVAAFLLQTAALGVRWYVSGRWPNSNMFEAVTTAAWFGSCAALLIEVLASRSVLRGLFALGAAVSSMVALMSVHFLPAYLSPQIGNMMPVLHDIWLYIHTNVIIFSYCLIFMAAVTALLYLGWRLLGGPPDYARVGGAGSLIWSERLGAGSTAQTRAVKAVLPGVGTVDVAMVERGSGGLAGGAAPSVAASATAPVAGRIGASGRPSLGEVLDGVTMIFMESSFVLLWAGIVMGAIWADHSWGRPWGWDPKEVFALNTFLVFAILIHVRLKAKDKGLWTAVLAVVGAGVMLFNWIVINFVITGLHSYA